MTLSAFTVYQAGPSPLGVADVIVAVLFLAAPDRRDRRRPAAVELPPVEEGRDRRRSRTVEPRFLQTGLFRYSRHPNFFFEQAQWWALYLFAIVATGTVLHWSILGPLLLTALFIGSTVFTESLSKARHPEYADYQASTSAIVPWFPRRRTAEPAEAPAS